jgi:hypothetical protein
LQHTPGCVPAKSERSGVTKAAQDPLILAREFSRASSIEDGRAAVEASRFAFGRRTTARARELGACLREVRATPVQVRNAAQFRTPEATARETATLEFLTG